MAPPRRPSAYVLALLLSPAAVLGLVGWTRLALARVPAAPESAPLVAPSGLAALAVERLWTAFDVEQGADEATLASFRAWLDARGIPAGVAVAAEVEGPSGSWDTDLVVRRTDGRDSVELAFARAADGARELLGAYAVGRRAWGGTGHALVGRELGCALCHVTVRPVAGQREPESVRIAALGDLVLRSDARVDVHGTLHLGGALLRPDGEPLAPEETAALRFAALDAELRLVSPAAGPCDLAPLETMDLVRLRAVEGRLLGRQQRAPLVVRRPLPGAFPGFDDVRPAPAPVSGARGLFGGRGGTVPPGGTLDDDDAGAPLDPTTWVDGHLWAVGTPADPLIVAGDVEVAGDLVLGGPLRGRGTLRARGRIVVVGSLRVAGTVALVAGTDLLAGAVTEAGGPAPFVLEAGRGLVELPTWVSPERLGRMGDRTAGPLALEAFCYAPRHAILVAPRGAASGDVHVRGGLAAETVAVHAPRELALEDDPAARALLELRAPRGLALRARRYAAPWGRGWMGALVSGKIRAPAEPRTDR